MAKRRTFFKIRQRESKLCINHEMFDYISTACNGADGIDNDQIQSAAHILIVHGYTKDTFEAEFKYISWNDYSGFPIRIKQHLKMFLAAAN